jgi:hypothetical protein
MLLGGCLAVLYILSYLRGAIYYRLCLMVCAKVKCFFRISNSDNVGAQLGAQEQRCFLQGRVCVVSVVSLFGRFACNDFYPSIPNYL